MLLLRDDDAAPLKTRWHHHLVSSLLSSACDSGGGTRDLHGNRAEVQERPLPDARRTELVVRRFQPTGAEVDEAPIVVAQRLVAPAGGRAALGLGPGGHIVVAWHDASAHLILARRFDPRGVAQGEAFMANTSDERVPRDNPLVAVNAAGACVVLWEHGGMHLRARLFGPQGHAFGPEIDI